jgi:hypothetical protein
VSAPARLERGKIHYRKLRGGYRDDRTEAAGSRSDGDTPTRLSLAPPVTPNSPPGEFRYPRPPVPSIGATVSPLMGLQQRLVEAFCCPSRLLVSTFRPWPV